MYEKKFFNGKVTNKTVLFICLYNGQSIYLHIVSEPFGKKVIPEIYGLECHLEINGSQWLDLLVEQSVMYIVFCG